MVVVTTAAAPAACCGARRLAACCGARRQLRRLPLAGAGRVLRLPPPGCLLRHPPPGRLVRRPPPGAAPTASSSAHLLERPLTTAMTAVGASTTTGLWPQRLPLATAPVPRLRPSAGAAFAARCGAGVRRMLGGPPGGPPPETAPATCGYSHFPLRPPSPAAAPAAYCRPRRPPRLPPAAAHAPRVCPSPLRRPFPTAAPAPFSVNGFPPLRPTSLAMSPPPAHFCAGDHRRSRRPLWRSLIPSHCPLLVRLRHGSPTPLRIATLPCCFGSLLLALPLDLSSLTLLR